DLILGRRSIRGGYERWSIPAATLERIVRCGCAAPRSKGASSLRLTVITNPSRLCDIAEAVRNAPGGDKFTPHDPRTGRPRPAWTTSVLESADVLTSAPVGIFI